MHHSFTLPTGRHPLRDWTREYLTHEDNNECNQELNEPLDDLQNTMQVMFDDEIARRVREVERKGYYSEASYIPAQHNLKIHEASESSESEPELKPEPLFSGRRKTTYTYHSSSSFSSPGSSSECSAISSFDMPTPTTIATTMSPVTSPVMMISAGIQGLSDYGDDNSAFSAAPKNSMRNSADRATFSPHRSSMQFKIDTAHVQEPTTYTNRTQFNTNLGNSRPFPQHYAGTDDMSLQHATFTTASKLPSQSAKKANASTSTPSYIPFTKIWAPPPYTPTRYKKSVGAGSSLPRSYGETQRKFEKFQKDRVGLQRSISTSSLTTVNADDTARKVSSTSETRKDSFGLVSTPRRPDPSSSSSSSNPGLENDSTWILPRPAATESNQLGTSPCRASDQLMIRIEDGVKALRYVDDSKKATSNELSSPAQPARCHGGIRRIASAASGHLQGHFSLTFTSSEARSSIESRRLNSPTWPAASSMLVSERIVDPNGLLSSPPRPYVACQTKNRPSPDARPTSSPLRTKHPQVQGAGATLPTSPTRTERLLFRERHGLEMERIPPKALRVLGSFDALTDVEAREERERRRARKKRKVNEVLEVISKVLELG